MAGRCALVVVVAAALVAVGSGCTVNPVTGQSQLDLMGEGQEVALGAQLYPRYTQSSLGEVADPALQSYVDQVVKGLATVSHRPALDYRCNAVNEPAVNAYALPGGKISITRGLLARLDSEDALAAVLAHETGHVTARHSAQQYTRAVLAQAAVVGAGLYMESQGTEHRDLYTMGGLVGAQLLLARYSREQERQADALGLGYAVAAGYNPSGMIEVMEVLSGLGRSKPNIVERMLASHPLTEERIATARAAVAAQPADVAGRPHRTAAFLERTRTVRAERPAYDRLDEARRLLGGDQVERARGLLEQSVAELPSDGLLRAYLAVAEMKLKRAGAAMTNADRAARDAGGLFYPQVIAGQVFLAGDRPGEALPRLDRAEELLPGVPEVSLLRGTALEKTGRRQEAVDAYRKVLTLTTPDTEEGQEATRRLQALGAA